MSHPFGELLKQYRRRKPGLSQERLAHRIGYDEAVLVRMSQGKKDLTGPSGRDRVIRLIEALHDEGTLHTQTEANALLAAAALPPLYVGIPVERMLLQNLRPDAAAAALPTGQLSPIRYTLPAPVSSFIGREHDIAEIAYRFKSTRLLTLTGAGGSGKTRLALVAATQQLDAFLYGVCFVGLATVRQAKDVLATIALALDVRESPDMPLLDSIKRFLANKSLLLLVDNVEHVLESATVITDMLVAAPNLKVMATSREPLRLTGEYLYSVEPLSVNHAVELFTQRAQAVKPGFRVTASLEPIVIDICRRMDCLPLALELAAARVRQFSSTQLLANLNEQSRLSILINAPRDAPARHRTLRDAIAWSYALLSPHEQQALCALSVFVGGGELEQIALIQKDFPNASLDQQETATCVQSLVDKNLVRTIEQPNGIARYFLLELIREFSLEQLQEREALNTLRQAHAQAFLQLARAGMWEMRSHAQLFWHDRIERDYPNFREALTWSFDQAGSPLIGCQLVEALTYFWFIATRYLSETQAWTEKARAVPTDGLPSEVVGGVYASIIVNGHLWPFADWVATGRAALVHYSATQDVRGIAIAKYGLGAGLLGINPHDEEGLRVINECLALCRKTENEWMESHALHVLARHFDALQNHTLSEKLHRDMVGIRRRLGNVMEISIGLWQLADVVSRMNRLHEANDYLKESAALARQLDSPQDVLYAERIFGNNLRLLGDVCGAIQVLRQCVALARSRLPANDLFYSLILLSKAHIDDGNHVNAYSLLDEACQIIRQYNWPVQNQAWRDVLDGFATVLAIRGNAETAAQLWGTADVLWEAAFSPRSDLLVNELAPYRTLTETALSDAIYAAAYAEGRAMTLEQAIDLALSI